MLPPSELTWDLVEPSLLALAANDLDAGRPPLAMLVAFAGPEPLAVVTLRPFPPGGLLQPVIEVLALVIPLGTDRLALSLAGRVWPLDEAQPDAVETDDVTPVVTVTVADGCRNDAATLTTTLHPYEVGASGWRWGDPITPPEAPEGEVPSALVTILDARRDLTAAGRGEAELAAQLGRVLLLGHVVALAPGAAARFELAGPFGTR